MKERIKKMLPENGINILDSQLGDIAYNINIAKQASTKFTLYFLMFKRQARTPLQVFGQVFYRPGHLH